MGYGDQDRVFSRLELLRLLPLDNEHLDRCSYSGRSVHSRGGPGYADAIAISPTGVAYATKGARLYSLNLTDATLALIGTGERNNLYGFAFNPAGVLYGLDYNGNLYTVNTTTGASTAVTTFSFPSDGESPNSLGIQFDSSGILWVENNSTGPRRAILWSVDLTAADPFASAVRSGAFIVGERYYYHEALLIVPCAGPVLTSAAEPAGTVGSAFTYCHHFRWGGNDVCDHGGHSPCRTCVGCGHRNHFGHTDRCRNIRLHHHCHERVRHDGTTVHPGNSGGCTCSPSACRQRVTTPHHKQ